MPEVFLSHSSEDRQFVKDELLPRLESAGVSTWFADREIVPSERWERVIREGLLKCEAMLVVVSRASLKSEWVKTEVTRALALDRRIVCLVVDGSDPADLYLRLTLFQHVEWNEPAEAVRKLQAAFLHQAPQDEEPPEVQRLRELRERPDPARLPFVFGCLSDENPGVRKRAQQVIEKTGWDVIGEELERLVREGPESTDLLLKGLASIESHEKPLDLLVRLCELLTGKERQQAIALTEKKRLSLGLARTAALFREFRHPYVIESVLGQGLFVASYLARHAHARHPAVIRVLRPEMALQDRVRTQFIDLGNRALTYVHPKLALTRDVNQIPERKLYYVIRDYVDGVTLRDVLARGRRFEPLQVIEILRQLVAALEPIHQHGAVHGGIKPSNIFVTGDHDVLLGDPAMPLSLAPLGLSRLAYDYRYAAPETFDSKQEQDPGADVYSLGCVAYELFSGQPPFASDNPFELAQQHQQGEIEPLRAVVGAETDDLLRALLRRRPEQRPGELGALLERLDRTRQAVAEPGAVLAADITIVDADARLEAVPETTLVTMGGAVDFDGTIVAPGRQRPPAQPPRPPVVQPKPPVEVPVEPPVPPAPVQPESGELGSIGRYRLQALLGEGGMGRVYKALDTELDRPVAIKLLHQQLAGDPQLIQRFRRETRALARLDHPNIVRAYDFGEHEGHAYLVMEYVEGREMQRIVAESGPLTVSRAADVILQTSLGLAHAHERNIIHRDVKPSNLQLTPDGVVKIMDMGIARIQGDAGAGLTQAGSMMGTVEYAPPEQLRNPEAVDHRADIYSLGGTFFFLLTGASPVGKAASIGVYVERHIRGDLERLGEYRGDVPSELQVVLTRMMATDPGDRFDSMKDVISALERAARSDADKDRPGEERPLLRRLLGRLGLRPDA